MHNNNERKSLYISILLLSIAVTLFSGTLLYLNTLGASAPPEFITLSETDKISFKAHLTDTEPFGRPYLSQTSDHVPADILDHIELSTNYLATLSSQAVIHFSTSATVTVVATQNRGGSGTENNPVILNRTFSLCSDNELMTHPGICPDNSGTSTQNSIDGTEYSHQHTYKLYLQPYIDYVASTTEHFANFPVKASITIDFQTSANNNDQLRSIMKRSVIIPLSDTTFQITITGSESQSNDFYALERTPKEIILLVVFGVLIIAGLGVSMFIAKKLLNKKSPYRQEVDGYLSDYADAIVKTLTPPELDNHPEHIAVESFKELLNLAVSISDPILCYETPTSAIFYITRNSIIYYYIVQDQDIHHDYSRQHRRKYIEQSTQEDDTSYAEVITSSGDISPEDFVENTTHKDIGSSTKKSTLDNDDIPPEILAEFAPELKSSNHTKPHRQTSTKNTPAKKPTKPAKAKTKKIKK
jgi:hypothetical protein